MKTKKQNYISKSDWLKLSSENAQLRSDLYSYRTTALEIFEAVANMEQDKNINKTWVLARFRRCLK